MVIMTFYQNSETKSVKYPMAARDLLYTLSKRLLTFDKSIEWHTSNGNWYIVFVIFYEEKIKWQIYYLISVHLIYSFITPDMINDLPVSS